MEADYLPSPEPKTTVSSRRHARSRAVLTALASLMLAPLALVGAVVAVGITAATGPLGASLAAVALFAAPVLLPWLAVNSVTAAIEHGQA
jgi:hypothetical protein